MIRRRRPLARNSAPLQRKSRPRRQRKGSRAALKRRCDKIWSLIIRASNGGRCKLAGQDHVRCGGPLQAAHLFGRGHHSVRHELWNGWPLCAGHHVWYSRNPEAWTQLLLETWGVEGYAYRYREAQVMGKPDYEAIEAALKASA